MATKLLRQRSNSFTIISRSAVQTRSWGRRLGRLLEGGEIIGLMGELGSGKTCFVRGLAEGLEVDPRAWVRSPSFTLINEYDGRVPLYHVDLYRITGAGELEGLNLREYLYSDGVCVVEWFENLPEGEAGEFLRIVVEHVDRNQRRLSFKPFGTGYEKILQRLSGAGGGMKRSRKGAERWA